MVLETELQHAENTHSLARIKIPESMQRFQDKQWLDQFFKLTFYDILASADLKSRFLPQQRKIEPTGWWHAEGKTRYVEELHLNDPDHNPTSSELLLERSVAKEREPGSTKMEPSSSIEETHAKQLKIQTNPVCNCSEEFLPIEERKWHDIPACQQLRGNTFEAEVSKLVMRLVAGGHRFSDSDWLQHIYKRSNKTRLQHCKNSRHVLLYIRAIQGHNGGNLIVPELMGHVAIPNTWKEFLLHRGCSRDVTSILKSGLIAVRRASKEGRQTIFFTPLNPPGHNPDEEEPGDDLSKPRQIHYYSKWEPRQDAVFWINLARAQDKGLQFWQTRTDAVIVYNSVPADCIYKVMSQKGKKWHLKDCRRLVLHRRQYSRVTHRRVLLQAPRNWCVKRNKVPQQTTQTHRASGNRCEVLSHLLRKRSLNFKSTSEFKDLRRMWF